VVVGHTPQESGEMVDLGFLVGIETNCRRGGWLTALEETSGAIIQTNQARAVRRSRRR
jgi:serine/threonine protein phosphatase 1